MGSGAKNRLDLRAGNITLDEALHREDFKTMTVHEVIALSLLAAPSHKRRHDPSGYTSRLCIKHKITWGKLCMDLTPHERASLVRDLAPLDVRSLHPVSAHPDTESVGISPAPQSS